MSLTARSAHAGDAAAIAATCNEGIADRMATCETEPRGTAERQAEGAWSAPVHRDNAAPFSLSP
ncbi:MAG: hypothetical protein P4L71_10390 [Acetobacteraceae bacterium]|nr:hypothetical protein [Acetobacteraceae bacterium]